MRKTKIICTIGPACDNEYTLTEMCKAGMNITRLNFSHGTHEEHQVKINLIRKVREKLNLPIPIMLDTKGPEYRLKTFENGKITLREGDTFTFTTDDVVGDQSRVSVSYPQLHEVVEVGERILVSDGLMTFRVKEISGHDIICSTETAGDLSDRKGMNFPGKVLPGDYLSEQDKSDLLFGIKNDVDFVAASFVSTKEDVQELRNFLDANGGKDIDIIAKIENRSGVDNIDGICEIADSIMVARGDLGVEIPFVEVPAIQKFLIRKCRLAGKRVITATEMMESMIKNPRPTRAEISDVANAVYDGSSAVMLSGETAAGKYPVEAVASMADIAGYTEGHIDYAESFHQTEFKTQSNLDAVTHATCAMAIDTQAKAIVCSSLSGMTIRMISRFRCPVDIMGLTTNEKAWRKLNLSWGVTPILCEEFPTVDVLFFHAVRYAQDVFDLKTGDNVVLTGGQANGVSGNTNTLRLETIKPRRIVGKQY